MIEGKRYLRRGVHFDFHTMPGIYDFGRDFDAAVFAQKLADAHVEIINMFAQCNLGFSYYPTKIGTPYPYMKGDMFGDVLRECHARNIKVVAYVNVGLNHELVRKRADWTQVMRDGSIIYGDRTLNFCRNPCYNTGYGDHMISIIKEVCDNYDVDGIFTDCMCLRGCYCNKCTEDMIARGIDINDHNAVVAFSHEVMVNFSRRVREVVPAEKLLYLNGMATDEMQDCEHHIEVECLPSGGWGYDSFLQNASYARNLQKDVLYMTGRFQASWGDFGGFKSRASIENDIYDALCAGVQYSVGDHIHPAENIESDIYDIVGDIYSKTMKYEKYTDDAVFQTDIGMLRNFKRNGGAPRIGLVRMLAELKQSCDCVNENMDLSRFKLVIVPDDVEMNDKTYAKLREYIDNGGKVIFSGTSGLKADKSGFAFPELDDMLEYNGIDATTNSYYITREKICEAQLKYSMYSDGIFMTAKDDAIVKADYIKPYFTKHWDGLHGYFYTPPEKKTGHAAAVLKGNVAYISFKIFGAYNQKASVFHKMLIKSIIDEMLPEPLIKCPKMPSTSRVTLTGNDDYKLLHVKVTYPEPRGPMDIIEEHVTLPAGREVSVRGKYDTVALLPDETPVKAVYADGYTTVTLPEITGYDMFLLK